MIGRLEGLRSLMGESGLEAFLVTRPENRVYLSGFTGTSGWLLITPQASLLLTDFRYVEQASHQASGFEVVRHAPGNLAAALGEQLKRLGAGTFGFEKDHLRFSEYQSLSGLEGWKALPIGPLVERLRVVKDRDETSKIGQAIQIAERAWEQVQPLIRPETSEAEIAIELECRMRRLGAQGTSFEIIVASGPRGALPHGVASGRTIKVGDLVTVDFGCRIDGYCSDLTRTVCAGQPSERMRHVYQVVLEAQMAACRAVRPGMTARELDAVARDLISSAGYGDYFGHGLGHGVGLEVHEAPRLAPSSEEVLAPGMIVTVEPGVYLPGVGGVRIEDMVLITESGGEVITNLPKDLLCF